VVFKFREGNFIPEVKLLVSKFPIEAKLDDILQDI